MKKLVSIILFCSLTWLLHAQKVAVVLSGGGAKGVTHIGVLKALEENGIPIDYIAGTSMGAIIGGLYASGYSPDSMMNIINSEEFTRWISGKLDPEYIYFFRQPFPNAGWINFKFKYDSVLQTQLPTNIVSPVRMDFAFLSLFSQASAASTYNFDSLMIPFRCVASDVRASKAYIMKQGDVGKSIRASMTFPFYFKPIRIEGKLLFDGGMYNNFPSDVVLNDFYPDIIIGSKAASKYSPPEDDDVVSHITNMLMGETRYDVFCDASVLIEPNLLNVNVIDFSHTKAFIDSGYYATQRIIPEIRKFVIDTVTQQQHNAIRERFNQKKPPILINDIQINGLQEGQASYITNVLIGTQKKHKYKYLGLTDLSLEDVRARYFKVLGENRIKNAFPTLLYDTISKKYRFIIDAQYDNTITADFGGSISSGATNEIFLQLQYNHWRRYAMSGRINGYFGRFYNSASLGGKIEFPGINPLYLEVEYTFNQFNYFRTKSFFFTDKTPVFLEKNESYARLSFGFPLTYKGRFEAGVMMGLNTDRYFNNNYFTENDKLDKTYFDFYCPYFEFEVSNLNKKQYSNQGKRFYAGVKFISGTEEHYPGTTSSFENEYQEYHNYFTLQIEYERYFNRKRMFKPGLYIAFQATSLSNFRNFTSSSLNMPIFAPIYEMSTLYQAQYRPKGFFALGERNVISLYKKIDLRIEGYVMAPFRELHNTVSINELYGEPFSSLRYALSASLVYDTPIGPLSASVNKYDNTSKPSFFVNLGYLLFNRRPFNP